MIMIMNKPLNSGLYKQAKSDNPYEDVLAAGSGLGGLGAGIASRIGTSALVGPVTAGMLDDLGALGGYIYPTGKISDKALKDFSALSFIPGVSKARGILRGRKVDKELSDGKVDRRALFTESLGTISLPLIIGLAGYLADKKGLIGDLGSKDRSGAGGGIAGAGIGAAAAIAAYLTGLARKRRSRKEHKEYLEDSPALKNLLIPLYAPAARGRRDRMKLEATLAD